CARPRRSRLVCPTRDCRIRAALSGARQLLDRDAVLRLTRHLRSASRSANPVGFANSSAARWASGPLGSLLLSWSREGCLLWSFVYLVVRNLFALVWLLARPRRSKELEILVLRHVLAVLRRQARP